MDPSHSVSGPFWGEGGGDFFHSLNKTTLKMKVPVTDTPQMYEYYTHTTQHDETRMCIFTEAVHTTLPQSMRFT